VSRLAAGQHAGKKAGGENAEQEATHRKSSRFRGNRIPIGSADICLAPAGPAGWVANLIDFVTTGT
jgi:hypothetical protein